MSIPELGSLDADTYFRVANAGQIIFDLAYIVQDVVHVKAVTYTQARENLAKTISSVCEDHAPVIITKKGTEAVVMISLEDYEAMEETTYLLRSPRNTKRLLESIEQLERGKGKERELLDQ